LFWGIWLFRFRATKAEGEACLGRRGFRRTVVEVRDDLHGEVKRLALLNDLRIYVFVNAILEEFLRDKAKVKALIRRLRVEQGNVS